MSILDKIFKRKNANTPEVVDPEVMADALMGAPVPGPRTDKGNPLHRILHYLGGRVDNNPLDTVDKQYGSYVGWVNACVSLIAQDMAASEWSIHVGEEELMSNEDYEAIPPQLAMPNGDMTLSDLVEFSCISLDLVGTTFWNQVSVANTFYGVQYISSEQVQEPRFEEGTGRLIGWYVIPTDRPGKVYGAADFHLALKHIHPQNVWGGMSPVQAFATSHEMDKHARAYISSVIKNDARIPGLVTSEQVLRQEDADAIEARVLEKFGEGAGSKRGPLVLGKGASYERISMSIEDLAFLELAQLSFEQIAGIYKVPPAKLAVAMKGGTLEMTREHSNNYARNCIMPRHKKVESAINLYIIAPLIQMGVLPKGSRFKFKSPLISDLNAIQNRALQALQAGTITVNQFLIETGRESIGEMGDVYYLPMNVRVSSEIEERDPYDIIGGGGENSEGDQPAPEEDTPSDSDDEVKSRLSLDTVRLSGLRYGVRQERLERALFNKSRKNFETEKQFILKNTPKTETKGLSRADVNAYIEAVNRALDQSRSTWRGDLEGSGQLSYRQGWDLVAGDGVPSAFLVGYSSEVKAVADNWVESHAAQSITNIDNTTRTQLNALIAESFAADDSVEDLRRKISEKYDVFKGERSLDIARTETSAGLNTGKRNHAEQSARDFGVRYLKTWSQVEGGENRRPEHSPDSVVPTATIPFNQSWIINGEAVEWPHAAELSAKNVVKCQCTATLEVVA